MAAHIRMNRIAHDAHPLVVIIDPNILEHLVCVAEIQVVFLGHLSDCLGIFGESHWNSRRVIWCDCIGGHQHDFGMVGEGELHYLSQIPSESLKSVVHDVVHAQHDNDEIGLMIEYIGLQSRQRVRRRIATYPCVNHFKLSPGMDYFKHIT